MERSECQTSHRQPSGVHWNDCHKCIILLKEKSLFFLRIGRQFLPAPHYRVFSLQQIRHKPREFVSTEGPYARRNPLAASRIAKSKFIVARAGLIQADAI